MSDVLRGLGPLINDDVHTLIIGTFPGVESLNTNTYYGNEKNHFWDILYRCLDADWPPYQPLRGKSREERYTFALKHGIGIWDIVQTCERRGGQDAKIKNPSFNLLAALLREYPSVRRMFFNGKKVAAFLKQSKQTIPTNIVVKTINSTSTLNPNNTFCVLEEWQRYLGNS